MWPKLVLKNHWGPENTTVLLTAAVLTFSFFNSPNHRFHQRCCDPTHPQRITAWVEDLGAEGCIDCRHGTWFMSKHAAVYGVLLSGNNRRICMEAVCFYGILRGETPRPVGKNLQKLQAGRHVSETIRLQLKKNRFRASNRWRKCRNLATIQVNSGFQIEKLIQRTQIRTLWILSDHGSSLRFAVWNGSHWWTSSTGCGFFQTWLVQIIGPKQSWSGPIKPAVEGPSGQDEV